MKYSFSLAENISKPFPWDPQHMVFWINSISQCVKVMYDFYSGNLKFTYLTLKPTSRKFQAQGLNDHYARNLGPSTVLLYCSHWRFPSLVAVWEPAELALFFRNILSLERLVLSRLFPMKNSLSFFLSFSSFLLSFSTLPLICVYVYLHRFIYSVGFILYTPLGSLFHSLLTIY